MLFGILLAAVVFVAIVGIGIVYSTFSWGFVLYKFWGWFLIPALALTFPDVTVNQISFPLAVGIFMFTTFFKNHETQVVKKEYKDETASNLGGILAPWITLFIGWLVIQVLGWFF